MLIQMYVCLNISVFLYFNILFKDKQPCEQNVPNHSTEQYSLAQSVETEERNDETERVSDVSEHDYEDPPGDEYMNADEINTVTIGHQIYHLG